MPAQERGVGRDSKGAGRTDGGVMVRSRQLGLLILVALLAQGCAQPSDKEQDANGQNKTELARSLLEAAGAALTGGDAATAATYYRGVYTREPDNIEAAVGLMQSLRLAGGLDEARSVEAKALAARPHDPTVLAEAGKVQLAAGQPVDAIKLLQQADAGDWRVRSAMGLAYDRLGDYARADENYRAALDLSADNAAVLNNYALSRVLAGDIAGARALAQRATAASGANLRVRTNLALIYALSGNLAKAEELTRRDLPPALARDTLNYYRELADAAGTKPTP